MQQMYAEGPAVGSTRTSSYVNHSYGLGQKERFLESNEDVAALTKRIRSDAGPNEISSDIPYQKLVNRFAPENSLLYFYGDTDSTATYGESSHAFVSTLRIFLIGLLIRNFSL
jgi:hypothetical protein